MYDMINLLCACVCINVFKELVHAIVRLKSQIHKAGPWAGNSDRSQCGLEIEFFLSWEISVFALNGF